MTETTSSFKLPGWAWLVGVAVVLGLWAMNGYNSLVTLDTAVAQKVADLDSSYQRRFDLIPNLVSTVKGSANFEQSTLTAVTAARSAWAQAGTLEGKQAVAGNFESALSRLLVTVEAYPQLTSTVAFRDLMSQLEGTENRVNFARKDLNEVATSYNTAVRRFPRNLIAKIFGFDASKPLFAAEAAAATAPKVNFEAAPATTPAAEPATPPVAN